MSVSSIVFPKRDSASTLVDFVRSCSGPSCRVDVSHKHLQACHRIRISHRWKNVSKIATESSLDRDATSSGFWMEAVSRMDMMEIHHPKGMTSASP